LRTTDMATTVGPVIVQRRGNVLTVKSADGKALPQNFISWLTKDMEYKHVEQIHGAAAVNPITGMRQHFKVTDYRLFRVDQGAIILLGGYLARVASKLKKANIPTRLLDVSPPRPRPMCFTPRWENLEGRISFRPRQRELLEVISRVPCGVVKAVTGFGKTTCIGAAALLFPEAKIHVVTKSVDVAERIVRSLKRFLPKVGMVGDGRKQWERVTVITAGSLEHSDGDADFLFADEVHQLATVNFSTTIAGRYLHSRNFGLSATPYARMDGAHAVLEPLFGPMVFDLPYQQAVELGLVVPIRVRWLPIRLARNPVESVKNPVSRKKYGIWTNQDRNRMIAAAVSDYPEEYQILILVETIEHAVNLGSCLPDFTLVYSTMYPSDCSAYKRKGLLPPDYKPLTDVDKCRLRDQFEAGTLKRVIATDVWSTGVDFEQLNVLVRADARASDIVDVQGPGRVSRTYTSPDGARKEYGEVIDCIDNFDANFYRRSEGRRKSYKLLGWEQDWHAAQKSWRNSDAQ
jgi:superfamily II DNA or RNA helicase